MSVYVCGSCGQPVARVLSISPCCAAGVVEVTTFFMDPDPEAGVGFEGRLVEQPPAEDPEPSGLEGAGSAFVDPAWAEPPLVPAANLQPLILRVESIARAIGLPGLEVDAAAGVPGLELALEEIEDRCWSVKAGRVGCRPASR